jgi:diguanylate cyclase (GGDEF)-like protein
MSRAARTRIFLAAAVLAIAVSVWVVSHFQQQAAEDSFEESRAADQMLVAALDQEAALRGFALTQHESFLSDYNKGGHDFVAALREAEAGAAGDPKELRALDTQVERVSRWQTLAESEIDHVRRTGSGSVSPRAVHARAQVLDGFTASNALLQGLLRKERKHHLSRATLMSDGLIVVLVLLFSSGFFLVERRRREDAQRSAADKNYRDTQADFTQAMQVTRSESEAYQLLKRHLERSISDSDVVVLNRNNSDNRLEAATPVPGDSPLRETLEGAEPNSCLAIRLARTHERDEREQLVECDVCGAMPGKSTCIPSLVGGEVIGSVLVRHADRLDTSHEHRVSDSVTQAAPVLANLRNLELARVRAATDALTGLGNVRTVNETLKRMLAQAGRTVMPMSVLLIDLDHFKRINDTQGHAKGDQVLAAVGDVLASQVRDSDFVGRYGGEEFVALLPNTDPAGAAEIAEKLRRAVCELTIPSLDLIVTASFGVATYPTDAGDSETLLRLADRALYSAKEKGRNRVVLTKQPDLERAGSSHSS